MPLCVPLDLTLLRFPPPFRPPGPAIQVDASWNAVVERTFQGWVPDLILVSMGFDAHVEDMVYKSQDMRQQYPEQAKEKVLGMNSSDYRKLAEKVATRVLFCCMSYKAYN